MLFIDANIYLEFYRRSQSSMKMLLPSIESLKDEIFITSQVTNEVKRNKVKVAADSLKNYINNYNPPNARLPEHLDDDGEDVVEKWNAQSDQLRTKVKESHEALSDIAEQLLLKIMKDEDGASISLNKVFENALPPSQDDINNARLRKEQGNPPGKPTDSLGDQISWEQLLSAYDGASPLWIISNDNDYSTKVNRVRFLNSYLFSELKDKFGKEPEVFVFETLAEGISHFSEHRPKPVENLPSEEELKVIAALEIMQRKEVGVSRGFPDPIACYRCGEKEGFNGPTPKPSSYGGWTYQWLCKACGGWNDFGEPYED